MSTASRATTSWLSLSGVDFNQSDYKVGQEIIIRNVYINDLKTLTGTLIAVYTFTEVQSMCISSLHCYMLRDGGKFLEAGN